MNETVRPIIGSSPNEIGSMRTKARNMSTPKKTNGKTAIASAAKIKDIPMESPNCTPNDSHSGSPNMAT